MVVGSTYTPPPLFDPTRYSRVTLLAWVRAHAPDLQIRHAVIDGARRTLARFTLAGEVYERGDEDEDALARELATTVARLLRVPVRSDRAETAKLEREVIDAARRGDVDMADALGRELAMRNEGGAPGRVRTRLTR